MKNVLIPTDYTVQSLDLICKTAEALEEPINIYLFHAFELPTGISELLFMKEKTYNSFITEDLRQRCRKIKTQYGNIKNIVFKRMHGNTVALFSVFTEANEVQAIVLPDDYVFIPASKESVNPVKMFRKSGIHIINRFVYDKPNQKAKIAPGKTTNA